MPRESLTDEGEMEAKIPLVVDLDGTLLKSDLLHESYFGSLALGIKHQLNCIRALMQGGRARLKAYLANTYSINYVNLPYNESVLELIKAARSDGRPVYLATASDRSHAEAIAEHLALFDGVFASDGTINLKAESKAKLLVETFGTKGFDYVGNSSADLPIWAQAHKSYAINLNARATARLNELSTPNEHLPYQNPTLKSWGKALRVHQYAKNVLLFVPMLTSHTYAPSALLATCIGFISFSLCASSVYIINDIIDLEADRQHPTKSKRPFATGAIPIAHGIIVASLLLLSAFAAALAVSPLFACTLAAYFMLTFAYSVSLKRKMILDVVVLAILYTVRVIAGAIAIDVFLSEWLLAFSMFIFTCLALVKRYVELAVRIDGNLPDPSNRNYALQDITIIGALAAASGFNAITIFALYISSPTVRNLYHYPQFLWLICPILLYWVGRLLVLAQRRLITDDPIFFALRDRISYLTVVAMAVIVFISS